MSTVTVDFRLDSTKRQYSSYSYESKVKQAYNVLHTTLTLPQTFFSANVLFFCEI